MSLPTNEDILTLKKRLILEEHEFKLKILNEEHELNMEAKRCEIRASIAKENYYSRLTVPLTSPGSQIQYTELRNMPF